MANKARVLAVPDVPQQQPQESYEAPETQSADGGDPVTALMRNAPPPTPPHTEKAKDSGIDYEQAWAGWEQSARRMVIWKGILDQLGAVVAGSQEMAIVDLKFSWPTGKQDIAGLPVVAEMDLATLTSDMDVQNRKAWLRATYNYAVKEFIRWSKANAKYSPIHANLLLSN
jgi:hypothetical protein